MTLQDAIDLVQDGQTYVPQEKAYKALCVVVAVLQERGKEREKEQVEKERRV